MGLVVKSCSSEDLLVQQRSGWTSAKGRLRREDCDSVKHDKLFSDWKILVGPSDWSDHKSGKEGVHRYHLHNLPASGFGPGLYELGVTAPSWSPTSQRLRSRTLKKEDVMPVYVGQANNVRLRLQKYGQSGAHLEGSRSLSANLYQGDDDSISSSSPSSLWSTESVGKTTCNGPHLFSEVFALGSSIAYRWAETDSKVVSTLVESELLTVFDYAWNRKNNGPRRSRDILAKLFMAWPSEDSVFCTPLLSGKKPLFCGPNAVGIKVALRKPLDPPSRSHKTLGFLMTTPLHVSASGRSSANRTSLEFRCGALTDEGTLCSSPPVKGRKRCQQHKGKQVPRGAPLLPANEESVHVKQESVKVVGGSICVPRHFLVRSRPKSRPVLATEVKPEWKQECKAESKQEPGHAHGRRQMSLSFNTWMKMENERVHDSHETMPWSHHATQKEELEARILHLKHGSPLLGARSRYTPVMVGDSKEGEEPGQKGQYSTVQYTTLTP